MAALSLSLPLLNKFLPFFFLLFTIKSYYFSATDLKITIATDINERGWQTYVNIGRGGSERFHVATIRERILGA